MSTLSTKEIKLNSVQIEDELNKLQDSMQSLDTTFSKEIDGDNQLKFVDEINECKQKYDELLVRYHTLFLKNVELTRDAIGQLIEMDKKLASKIEKQMSNN